MAAVGLLSAENQPAFDVSWPTQKQWVLCTESGSIEHQAVGVVGGPEDKVRLVCLEGSGAVLTPAEDTVIFQVVSKLAKERDATLVAFNDASKLTADVLSKTSACFFFTEGNIKLDVKTFKAWVEGGGCFVGLHTTGETTGAGEEGGPLSDRSWTEFNRLVGCRYICTPYNVISPRDGDEVTIKTDPTNPLMKMYPEKWTLRAEIDVFEVADDVTVLMTLDKGASPIPTMEHVKTNSCCYSLMNCCRGWWSGFFCSCQGRYAHAAAINFAGGKMGLQKIDVTTDDVPEDAPYAWTREQGKGKVFYTYQAHFLGVLQSDQFHQHLNAALDWGLRPGSASTEQVEPMAATPGSEDGKLC